MFYGQYKTDKYIADFFAPDYVGTCIDVGAARPRRNSNTYFFEQNGWTVYCIEPNPGYIPALIADRKHVFNFAAGDQDRDSVEFTVCTLDGGNQEAVSALRVDQKLLEQHQPYQPKLQKTKVREKTLESFIREQAIKDIDFISIDTEGTELDVLKGLDLSAHKPRLLVIENNYQDQKIEDYLKNFGYTKSKRVAINDFYELGGA